MRKDIRLNIKKITALVLVAAMTLSMNVSAFAEIGQGAEGLEIINDNQEGVGVIPAATPAQAVTPAQGETPEPTPTVTPTQGGTPEPTPTATPAQGETPEATPTATPTQEEPGVTPTPTVTPEPSPTPEPVEDAVQETEGAQVLSMYDEAGAGDGSPVDDATAREKDMNEEFSSKRKLAKYLYQKYPEYRYLDGKDGSEKDESLSTTELDGAPITSLVIGGDFDTYPVGKNMVNFSALGYVTNLKSLVIDGVDEIRTISLPQSLTSLEIRNTTLNLAETSTFFSTSSTKANGGVGSCNFTNFVIDNCMIGDYRRNYGYGVTFTNAVELKIFNSSDLRNFKVNVGFESDDLEVRINGKDTSFDGLNNGTCSINKFTGIGKISISSTNKDSYFSINYNIVREAEINEYLKNYLLHKTYADKNGDKYLTEEEVKAITKLEIVYDGHNGNYLDAFHDLSDLSQLTGLEELKIDLGGGVRYINKISFPTSGSLRSVSITNTPTAFDATGFTVPSVEYFEYSGNTKASITGDENDYVANITINDTAGKLSTVKLDNSNVQNIVLSNTAAKRNLSLSASNCSKLNSIELRNNGYDLQRVDLSYSTGISKFGYKDNPGTNEWTINCVPDGSGQSYFDITNCAAFATAAADTIINFDLTGDGDKKSAVVRANGVNGLSNDHKLTIKRVNNVGNVYLYYDDSNTWMSGQYGSGSESGYNSETGSSIPSIAVFTVSGNHIRNTENRDGQKPYQRWVDCYDVVMCVGYDINETIKDNIVYYAEDSVGEDGSIHIIRPLNYNKDWNISLEVVNSTEPGVIDFYYDGDSSKFENLKKVQGKKVGKATINVYRKTDDDAEKVLIGQQNIMIRDVPSAVDLTTTHHTETGTYEDPIHIEKNSGELKLSGKLKWNSSTPLLPKEIESVLWMFGEYSDRPSRWIDMSASTATGYGINVVDNSYEGEDPSKTNTRVFSFNGSSKTFFKAIAQSPYKTSNASYIRKECYVEVTGPCVITPSSDTLVQGASGTGSVDITVTDCVNLDVTIKDEGNYNNLFKLEKVESGNRRGVWRLSTNGTDYAAIRGMMNSKGSITLIITADYGVHEKTINLSSAWGASSDSKPSGSDSSDSNSLGYNPLPEDVQQLIEQQLGITSSNNQEQGVDSGFSNENGGQDSQDSSGGGVAASSGAESSQGTSTSAGAATYTAPEKTTISEVTVVNIDGTSTRVAMHADGTISETKVLPATTVLTINDNSTLVTGAPTVITSVAVVVDKSGALPDSKTEKVTAELNATTVNGNISITPQMVKGINSAISDSLGTKASTSLVDIKVNTIAENGKPLSIVVSADSLKSSATLKAYIVDPATGGYLLVDIPKVKYNKKTGLTIQDLTGGFEYHFVSEKEAKRIENSILDSIKLSSDFDKPVTVTAGAILDMSKAIAPSLNTLNVSKIEYSVSGKKAVVDPNTGLLAVNSNAAKGTITVSIKITLRNGRTKTIKSKIKIS